MKWNARTGLTWARLTCWALAVALIGANLGCALWVDDKKHDEYMRRKRAELESERQGLAQDQKATDTYRREAASAKEQLRASQEELAMIQQQMLRIPPGVARSNATAKLNALKVRAEEASASPDPDAAKHEKQIARLKAEVASLHEQVNDLAAN